MSAEGASDSSAPRYAPPDPTLPEPWKGLIDGSSGVMYYWNPETNITQYEKPAAVPPPVPSGPPSVPSASKPVSAPGTRVEQPNGIPGQQTHQMFTTPEQQMPPQQGNSIPQSYQGVGMEQPQSYQYTHQQPMPYMGYQQRPPNMMQPPQHLQQYPPQQDHRAAFTQREDAPPVQSQPSDVNPIQPPPTQYGGPQFNMQQPSSFGQLQPSGVDYQQHGPQFQNQMGQQPNIPSVGSKMGFEDNPPGRGGNDHYFNAKNGGPGTAPHQPKLAAIPVARTQMNVTPTIPGGPVSHNMYGQATGGPPFMNNAMMRPNPAVMVSPDAMNLSSVDMYRQKHDVTATGDNVPAPFMSFESTGFPPELLREIYAAGFAFPTPIQAQTWPIALQNRDIVAIAKTGSGKTLGYLIPAFMLLRHCNNNPQNGPTVVVLAPTRELATQIQDEAIKFGRSVRISCTCLYGGAPKGPQLKELERGADIVVATPGRLNDILEMRKVDFRQVSLLVLDEADRMLDMGFEPQIRKIVNEIPPRRQTLMYTATWPKEVRKIAGDLLVNPVQVNIGNADELAANKSITQYVEVVPQMEKQRRVEQILRSEERGSKIIIFCSTKKLCDQLTRSISRTFGAAAIHGDKSQGERDFVLNQFRSGKSPILVATDVAARGLDVKDVRVVINYDFPNGVEDYVHRIGRTGRAGAKGVAYTFFSEQDWKHAPDLIKVLEGANQPVPHVVRETATLVAVADLEVLDLVDRMAVGIGMIDSRIPVVGAAEGDLITEEMATVAGEEAIAEAAAGAGHVAVAGHAAGAVVAAAAGHL
ncbi:putative RNA helicase [Helianthus annuus]|nr:putative RNA helicase [Helianthus annuus]